MYQNLIVANLQSNNTQGDPVYHHVEPGVCVCVHEDLRGRWSGISAEHWAQFYFSTKRFSTCVQPSHHKPKTNTNQREETPVWDVHVIQVQFQVQESRVKSISRVKISSMHEWVYVCVV